MTLWLDTDRNLLDRLSRTDSSTERIALLTDSIAAGERLLRGPFDTRLACDVMVRLAASYLLLTAERNDPADARAAATWATRAGRRALHNDLDTATIVPRVAAAIAAVLDAMDRPLQDQAVMQLEELLAGYRDAVDRLHDEFKSGGTHEPRS